MIEQAEPGQRAAGDKFLLFAIHRFGRASVKFRTTRFDFDENQSISFAADEIDFAAAIGAKVPVKNLIALLAQIARGNLLSVAAEDVPRILR